MSDDDEPTVEIKIRAKHYPSLRLQRRHMDLLAEVFDLNGPPIGELTPRIVESIRSLPPKQAEQFFLNVWLSGRLPSVALERPTRITPGPTYVTELEKMQRPKCLDSQSRAARRFRAKHGISNPRGRPSKKNGQKQ
jgi:hypothetical protein